VIKGLLMKRAWNGMVVLVALALAACGGGNDRSKAHVRLVNASSGYSTLSLVVDGAPITSNAAYGASADYSDASRGTQDLDVSSPNSAAVLSTRSASLSKDNHYTLLAYGKAGALATVLLDDNNAAAATGKTLVRLLNAAPDAGGLDVYLTGTNDALAQATALQTGVAYGSLGTFIPINSGTWRLRVTGVGNKDDLRLDVSSLAFESTAVKTLVLTPGAGGVLVRSLLLTQQGDVSAGGNAQARVRVVAGVSGGAAVTATVAGSTLMSAAAAPALTPYALVNAGTVAVAAAANGNATQLTTATLTGGGDYTLLVYGPATAPRAVLIADDNTLPSDSTRAKVRLVHGVADVAGTLSMKIDLVVVADAVASGATSPYALTSPSTTAQLDVTSSDGAMTAYSSSTRTFVAGSVYTLFMIGGPAAPVGALNKDR
jgi:hypothetical protein